MIRIRVSSSPGTSLPNAGLATHQNQLSLSPGEGSRAWPAASRQWRSFRSQRALLAAAKFIAGLVTGSLGILSEAVHSLIDFRRTAITYSAVRFADRPPDEILHHFGHAKAESIAALVETGLLFLTTA